MEGVRRACPRDYRSEALLNPLTHDDLDQVRETTDALDAAALSLRDLIDRHVRKGDHVRAGMLRVGALWKVERARELLDDAFA